VLLAHDVGYMLRHPFWVDEAWVALSTRARIGLVPWLTSTTPVGWTLLLRLVPGGADQRFRLVELGFTALAVLAGYYLGRELGMVRYLGGPLLGAVVLFAPAMLVRDDLKQYTAEAFASLALLLLVARIENHWTPSPAGKPGRIHPRGLADCQLRRIRRRRGDDWRSSGRNCAARMASVG
jgi:hypothetical protein